MNKALELVRSLLPRPAPWAINVIALSVALLVAALAWSIATSKTTRLKGPAIEVETQR